MSRHKKDESRPHGQSLAREGPARPYAPTPSRNGSVKQRKKVEISVERQDPWFIRNANRTIENLRAFEIAAGRRPPSLAKIGAMLAAFAKRKTGWKHSTMSRFLSDGYATKELSLAFQGRFEVLGPVWIARDEREAELFAVARKLRDEELKQEAAADAVRARARGTDAPE